METASENAEKASSSAQNGVPTHASNLSTAQEATGNNEAPMMVIVSSSVPQRVSQEERRRRRRRLHRILNNPDKMLPSFLRAIEVEPPFVNLVDSDNNQDEIGNGNKKRIKEDDILPQVDEHDFLIEPPTVVIDVDEYLGLKRKVKREENEEPELTLSGVGSGGAASMLNHASGRNWYEGTCQLAMPEDATYLSEIQQWIRQNMEFFSATDEDAATQTRRTQIVKGRVGIRCIHCARAMEALKKQESREILSWPAGAVSYPVNFVGVHSNVIQKPQTHFEKCPYLPADSKLADVLERSRASQLSNSVGSRKRNRDGMTAALYWTVSCHRLGLVETNNGLRFGRDVSLQPLQFDRIRAEMEQESLQQSPSKPSWSKKSSFTSADSVRSAPAPIASIEFPTEVGDVLKEAMDEEDNPRERPLLREDHSKITAFMFLALNQAAFCHAGPGDFVTKGVRTKNLQLGYAGFACRHCSRVADLGSTCRKFPSSSDTLKCIVGTSFVPHLLECQYVPQRIQHALQVLKRFHPRQMKMLPYGSQGQFYVEAWSRIRSVDKAPDRKQALLMLEPKEVTPDDSEYIPDKTESAASSRRAGRRSVSDLAPILPRGPSFPVSEDAETLEVLKKTEENWNPNENDNLILPEDKDLISDYLFLCLRQLKAAVPESSDFRMNRRSSNLGSMAGFCCIHCADRSDKQFMQPSGRTFVSAPDGMAAAFNTSLYNHLLNCPGVPESLKRALTNLRRLHSKQCSSLAFGSQRRFFKRVFSRLNNVSIDGVTLKIENDEARLQELLHQYAFVHRKGIMRTNDFWQCMRCRMVPFECRAAESLFFVPPSAKEMEMHAQKCHGDDMCWDLVLSLMKRLDDKYGAGSHLVVNTSFCELVKSVIGNEHDVVSTVMSKLGKSDLLSSEVSTKFLWHRLPTSVNIDRVHEAYANFKSDLQSASLPDDFRACPEISELLQLLNCNIFLPVLSKQSATSANHKEMTGSEDETTIMVVTSAARGAGAAQELMAFSTPAPLRVAGANILSNSKDTLQPKAVFHNAAAELDVLAPQQQDHQESQVIGTETRIENETVAPASCEDEDGQFDDPE